jgi:hypothetical protein
MLALEAGKQMLVEKPSAAIAEWARRWRGLQSTGTSDPLYFGTKRREL